jgi:hypothetical protein
VRKTIFGRIARRPSSDRSQGPLFPQPAKGILAAPYNLGRAHLAPRFRPPVLSLIRSEIA